MQFASTNDALVVVWLQMLLTFNVFFHSFQLLPSTFGYHCELGGELWGFVCVSSSTNTENNLQEVE